MELELIYQSNIKDYQICDASAKYLHVFASSQTSGESCRILRIRD